MPCFYSLIINMLNKKFRLETQWCAITGAHQPTHEASIAHPRQAIQGKIAETKLAPSWRQLCLEDVEKVLQR